MRQKKKKTRNRSNARKWGGERFFIHILKYFFHEDKPVILLFLKDRSRFFVTKRLLRFFLANTFFLNVLKEEEK